LLSRDTAPATHQSQSETVLHAAQSKTATTGRGFAYEN